MDQSSNTLRATVQHPSAFIPLGMSLLALVTMLLGPFLFGDLHAKDEGPTAHIWQLLMAGQVPVVAFFALKWLRRAPREAWRVIWMQAGAVLANCAIVFLLGVG